MTTDERVARPHEEVAGTSGPGKASLSSPLNEHKCLLFKGSLKMMSLDSHIAAVFVYSTSVSHKQQMASCTCRPPPSQPGRD